MKRPLRPEEHRLWSVVAATVHPLPGRATPSAPAPEPPPEMEPGPALSAPARKGKGMVSGAPAHAPAVPTKPDIGSAWPTPEHIEPNRRHRIIRERDPIAARLDLHGLDYDRARAAMESFLRRAWDEGHRSVLIITGKGSRGGGILRRAAPEWLAAAHLKPIVAGVSEAHRRHGGEGALYVALKRKPRG